MSPLSKKHSVENLKGNVRKKAIAVKSKVDNVVSQLVKRKQPKVSSHRKKAKETKVKLSYEKVFTSLEVDKIGGVSSSSSVKVRLDLFLCVLFVCIIIIFLFSNRYYYYI